MRLLVFVVVFLGVASMGSDIPENIKSLTMNLSKQCKAKAKPTEEDMKVIKSEQIPDTKTGLCYLECLLEKMGMCTNGKFRKQGIITSFNALMKDKTPDYRKRLKEIAEEVDKKLSGVKPTEPCGMARLIFESLRQYENEVPIKLPTHLL